MNKKQEKMLKDIKDVGLTKEGIASKIGVGSAHFSMMLNGKATMPEEIRNKVNSIIEQARKIAV